MDSSLWILKGGGEGKIFFVPHGMEKLNFYFGVMRGVRFWEGF